jgi:DegV family protein with EDD domain
VIGIVTDSSADIPADIRSLHSVTVVPLTIRFGDESFTDGVDLDNAGFWSRLRSSDGLPETAAPSAGAFMDTYEALAREGAEGIVVLTLSSRLSATHQSAVIAAENMADDIPVRVIDSKTVTIGLGLGVIAAAERAAEGGDLEQVVAAASECLESVELLAVLDTLEFLRRGGRIGSAQALLGGLLDVKPLITVEDGVVAAAGRVRTRTKARAAIVERAASNASARRMAVFHGDAADVLELVEAVRELAQTDVLVAELGPVVGTHAGPGTLGLAYSRA